VNAISFFPIGSVVRTSRDELALVIATHDGDPLHPSIALIGPSHELVPGAIDTRERDASGAYVRHLVATLRPPEGLDVAAFLS
jgi:hypothetical protein